MRGVGRPLTWLYRRLGRRYFLLYQAFIIVSATSITAGTIGLIGLYDDPPDGWFLKVFGFGELCVLLALILGGVKVKRMARPLLCWCPGVSSERESVEAWRTAVGLPLQFVRATAWQSVFLVTIPISAFATAQFGLPFYSFFIFFAAGMVAVAYSAVLQFFVSENFLRPVVVHIASHMPPDFDGRQTGVPLRVKLLAALPAINVITGVVVSGLSTDGQASLEDLGMDVIIALGVAFSLSLELTVLVTRSVIAPVRELLEATDRVRQGDLSVRVPVASGDELGELSRSFNAMMTGVEERESLREALGSYVTPDVAERVVREGELLEGEEVEVTVMFIDIRGFTAFSDRASAREAVAHLNEFFELVVPKLSEHGGHANKFIGDGVLGVFGTPQAMPDHADRAVGAACEIATAVEEKLGERLDIGIGVNSGPVIAGTVGGGGKLDFTVIGDPVNVAARVEDLSAETGDPVLITEATRCLMTRSDFELEPRGSIPLRGKSDPVPIYAARKRDGEDGARPLERREPGRAPATSA